MVSPRPGRDTEPHYPSIKPSNKYKVSKTFFTDLEKKNSSRIHAEAQKTPKHERPRIAKVIVSKKNRTIKIQ